MLSGMDGNNGPSDSERKVLEAVARLEIPYRVIPCDPAAADTAAFLERYGYSADHTVNTIIVVAKKGRKRYAAGVLAASRLLDVNHKMRELLGAPLSFASADETAGLTGMMIGGVTPFALPSDLPIYLDEVLLKLDKVIVGSGGRTSKLEIAAQSLLRIPNAEVVAGLAQPR